MSTVGDFLGFTRSGAEDAAQGINLDLGNIFLPGGLQGGKANEQTPGGFGGSPLNQADWQSLNSVWGQVRGAANFGDINWDAHGGQKLTPEAQQFLSNNWGNMRSAANLGDINWNAGIVGTPGYAAPTPAIDPATGQPVKAASPLGDLEPARAGFAGVAADQINQVGANTRENILGLLRTQAQPFEQAAQNKLNNNLFMRGRLGGDDSVTGEAYRSFARGLSEADTQRQIAAYGLSDQLQTSALNRSLDATQGAGALTQLSTLPFEMALKLATARTSTQATKQQAINQSQGDSVFDAWSKFWSFA